MNRSTFAVALAFMASVACSSLVLADHEAKTITGKSACATCSGVTSAGHAVMIVTADGERWVLIGNGPGYKAAHDVRKQDKTMTATLAGEPVTKTDAAGKPYKEVAVSDVKIES